VSSIHAAILDTDHLLENVPQMSVQFIERTSALQFAEIPYWIADSVPERQQLDLSRRSPVA
jgi:hypothetical protein